MDGKFLQASSIAFVVLPAIWMDQFKQTRIEWILFGLLILNGIVSFCFWGDPVQRSDVHYLDGLLGRLSLFLFTVYVICIKNATLLHKFAFLVCLGLTLLCFHYSSYYSGMEWLCPIHVSWHMLFHGLIGVGMIFLLT
jgi:phosphatidylserine synthase